MNKIKNNKDITIGVIGLGYVGLPLALELSRKFKTYCYDKNTSRINNLNKKIDTNNELKLNNLNKKKIFFFNEISNLRNCNFFIISVPTPVTNKNKPNLNFLINATKSVSSLLKKNDVVVYESTVYPGATEEICVPILEKISKLKLNKDFGVGYSPERINPGDKKNTIAKIIKITSGSNYFYTNYVDYVYSSIIRAGTKKVKSIKIAEAAKVIENTQRDINIALINELSIIFEKLNIRTKDVLDAASTKWNFINFEPGLVGGHCIGVDPYYLAYKSSKVGHLAQVIMSGRNINNSMPNHIFSVIKKISKRKKVMLKGAKCLIMGFAFKENCSDFRNTKVIDLYNLLNKKNHVDIYDPLIDKKELKINHNIEAISNPKNNSYDLLIIAVKHKIFTNLGIKKINSFGKKNKIFIDLKNCFNSKLIDYTL